MTKKEILVKELGFRIAEIDESLILLIEKSMQRYAEDYINGGFTKEDFNGLPKPLLNFKD